VYSPLPLEAREIQSTSHRNGFGQTLIPHQIHTKPYPLQCPRLPSPIWVVGFVL